MKVRVAIRMVAVAAIVSATLLGGIASASTTPAQTSTPVHVASGSQPVTSGSVTIKVTIQHRIEMSVDESGDVTVRTNCSICAADLANLPDPSTAVLPAHGN